MYTSDNPAVQPGPAICTNKNLFYPYHEKGLDQKMFHTKYAVSSIKERAQCRYNTLSVKCLLRDRASAE